MELQNRYYRNLQQAAKMLEVTKDSLALQIRKISRGRRAFESNSLVLHVKGLRPTQHGLLYLIHISEKTSKKCVLNTPVLLVSPKRSKFVF